MAKVHDLIARVGLDAAKSQTAEKLDRQCVETAFAVMTDEERRIGIMHAGFAMTALPHKALDQTVWTRTGGKITLRIESGFDPAQNCHVGIPFGSIARMILLYLQTEAVKTRSRDIELGRSMNRWLTTMGLEVGGKTYRLVREQSRRLSMCRLTFYRSMPGALQVSNGSFVCDAILPTTDDAQLSLWREVVRLDEQFFASLIDHPMPVREAAIRQLGNRSMAIDVYIWLAYRLHNLVNPTPITWKALYDQFGGGFSELRYFKRSFADPLALALAAYPEAKVTIEDTGLTLYPSPPPVPKIQALAS